MSAQALTKSEGATTLKAMPTAGPGPDLRALRRSHGLTLAELADRVGRSVGWLSQVERGQSDPSIRDLRAMAAIFDLPLGFFFRHDEAPAVERGHVVRRDTRRTLGGRGGLTEELLSPDLGGSFEVFRSIFEPGAELAEPEIRPTEEAGYLISGRLDLWIGDSCFRLEAGDSFRFERQAFRWRNPGAEPAVVIWVIAPPVY